MAIFAAKFESLRGVWQGAHQSTWKNSGTPIVGEKTLPTEQSIPAKPIKAHLGTREVSATVAFVPNRTKPAAELYGFTYGDNQALEPR